MLRQLNADASSRARAAWSSCRPTDDILSMLLAFMCRPKKKNQKQDAYLQQVRDKKLKGQLKHTELLYREANKTAARVNQWLAPADAGFIEPEGGQIVGAICALPCLETVRCPLDGTRHSAAALELNSNSRSASPHNSRVPTFVGQGLIEAVGCTQFE